VGDLKMRNDRDPYKFDGYTIWDFTIHYIWADLCETDEMDDLEIESWNKMAAWMDLIWED
jgi:hypothetical protein